MEYKDYYQILGVPREAAADEIKKAFRRLARKYHPDVSKEPDAESRMQDINEAHAVLSDPEKRAAYDQLGRGYRPGQDFTPPPDWGSDFAFSGHGFSPDEAAGFSDFFAELFGRMGGGGPGFAGGRAADARRRGDDHQARVLLEVEDAFTGATRQISLRTPQIDAHGRRSVHTRTLNVKIPPGVYAGQVIRLAGQGAAGMGGAPPGDLLLEVRFRPHARYRVSGRDVCLTLPVTPWEAALGAVVSVDLPLGSLKVRIPPGAQSGRQVRVRGKGIPGPTPGDLLLDLQLVLPPADTARARALYETMARELAFNPRQEARR
ncbi:MAG: DnaJ C-terminal domain-containing protein [Candidatus Accumulibacter sp.]|uniref:DnaJ C-terminal domain-containing protein n=1 Tax=Accumulibacter sp. TaxID=2053492 RepID=UPI00287A6D9D|nr:DnaJ C-terminal domain-containing protein [Accumulibacter sp.]MDS4013204.1 DnaJ C-terminal domain-containing protein [Accumulibacter sp.]